MKTSETLAVRLKVETAALHRSAEQKVGLPDSVRTREEYANLLQRLFLFHSAFEKALSAPIWSEEWKRIGISLGEHSRSHLLLDDRSHFNPKIDLNLEEAKVAPVFVTFAQALGGLYVIEGSSLGGKILAPLFRTRFGPIPTRFYEDYGRDHPKPWRAVQAALSHFDEAGGDSDAVRDGAVATFESFGDYLSLARWQLV